MFSKDKNEVVDVQNVLVPVIETMAADLLTPLAVYLKLAEEGEDSFLLESVEGGANLARYSFIGVNPRMRSSSSGDVTTLKTSDREISVNKSA
ncbi:MAG: hypothetical protein ACJ72Z_12995, partial [Pyrinomonadaceae bacterium]